MGNLFSDSPKSGHIYTGSKPASTYNSTTYSTGNNTNRYQTRYRAPTPASRTYTPVNQTTAPVNRTITPVNRTVTPVNRVPVPAITNTTNFQNGRLGNQITTPRHNNRNSSFQNRRPGNRAAVTRDYSAPDDDFEDQKEYRIKRNYLFLYHYTNFESALGILESGVLKASQSGAYGSGVYLTDLRPWHGKERLLSNNWCEGPDSSYRSRATVCFEFISDQIKADRKCQDRKIWTVPNDISLPTYRPKLFLVFDDKDATGKREKIKKINELKRNPDTYNKIRQIKVTFL